MSIFSNILEKLGIKKPATTAATQTTSTPSKPLEPIHINATPATPATPAAPKPVAIPVVDVVSKLEALAKANPEKLDWKVSIVDLLKLLGMDSSLAARKELAAELGCPADKIGGDYSEMNVWLHKTVLQKIADNGGNIPASLLK
ncbi:MAG: DUF3597 domain-containing protein [Anaerolineaceae bacterium]|jgi:hypothetical protein|nr:DUF3597 domain-containing protein [Anaerolineaceae bacterium]